MSRIFLSPPHVSAEERALLLEAFDSNWIAPLGPQVDAFEVELAAAVGAREAAALSSGTAALHLALVLLGVGAGDEVLVSDLTFVASANVVRYVGATPVFVDCDADTWTIDPDLLAEALADRARRGKVPRALIAVDLYGQCVDYEKIVAICARYEVPVIQDASESLGATYRGRPAGIQGVMGVFSFNGNKIITTSGGGMLVSDRVEWIRSARQLASQARDPAPHYQHSQLGYNYRLSNLLAALGRGQLKSLSDRVEARRKNFEFYQATLAGVRGWSFMPEAAYGRSNRWLTCGTLDPQLAPTPSVVLETLAKDDIEARPVWKPMHLQPLYADCACYGGKVGERLFQAGLCLPSGSNLTDPERARIARALGAAFGGAQ
ncbi:MAG TPA: aminotransferase class I/II-fold pyridoxal phosphate-dependent enzyme [Polyangiaceae bacterium]|nr:aminotransferase class I/II-fold pyridoxal phosphate-dependent enzyme [Polyangiaceae bacterium]